MPKDNHSILQLYLDGPKSNFYTFFIVENKNNIKINSKLLFKDFEFLKNKTTYEILNAQKLQQKYI